MNQGIHPFPTSNINSSPNSGLLSLREFDASGSFTIPPSTKYLYIFARGAGGGGGGGRRAATSATGAGGGGGAGGAWILDLYPVEIFGGAGTTLSIIIGAGGSIGAGGVADNTNGSGGGSGGATQIYVVGKNSYPLVCQGGGPGGGGSTVGGSASSANTCYMFKNNLNQNAGSAGATGSAANFTPSNAFVNSPGGAGGGGYTVAGGAGIGGGVVYCNAAGVGVFNPYLTKAANLNIHGGTRSSGLNNYTKFGTFFSPHISAGGGGGNATVASAAGNGGPGYRGGGGGGGGGSIAGGTAGSGGIGGNGYVAIAAMS